MNAIKVVKENGALDYRTTLDTITLWLQLCKNGTYTITMKKVQETRSKQQNNYMWFCFTIIAKAWTDATGRVFTKEDAYNAYCLMFLPVETPKGRVAGSTSSLTMEEMSEFIERVKADAAQEYGINIPNAEDKFFAALAEEYSNK